MKNTERKIRLPVKIMRQGIPLPAYKHAGDAGFDLASAEDRIIPAGNCSLVSTGLAFAVPDGFELQIRMRSGAARNTPLIMPNAPATIDAGYRGEIFLLLRNLSGKDWPVSKGERLAQAVLAPVFTAIFEEIEILPQTERGTGAFGSTGKF